MNKASQFLFTTIGGGLLGIACKLVQIQHMGCTNGWKTSLSLISYFTIGAAIATALNTYANENKRLKEFRYVLWVCIRYLLAYKLVFYALGYTEGDFFSTSLTLQDLKVADLSPGQIVWNFMGYEKSLIYALGSALMLSALLLSFRKLAFWGGMLSVGLWTMLSCIDASFGLCMLPGSLCMLALSSFVVSRDLPNIISLINGKTVTRSTYPIMRSDTHIYRSFSMFKMVLMIGSMAFFANQIWRSHHYYKSNEDSPIVGVWDIIDMQYTTDTGQLKNDTIPIELAEFKSLFLDKSRFGAVKVKEDSLSMFEYIVDSNYNQLEFWNFFDYKDLDLKGKYFLEDPDTLIYSAKNQGDSLRIVLKRNPRYKPRD